MCSEIFSRKINYSSCNLSSFRESQSVRFSEKLFWSKMTLSDFLTVGLRANPELSIFWRVLLAESAFSDFQTIRFWRKESRLKIKSEQGSVKVVLKERLAAFSQRSKRWQFFSCLLHLSDHASAECPHPFLSYDWFRSGGISFDFLPLSKENTKRLGWSDFQPSLFV